MSTFPLAYTVAEAVKTAAVSRTELYRAAKRGDLTFRKRGKRTLIFADELKRWLDTLPTTTASALSRPAGEAVK